MFISFILFICGSVLSFGILQHFLKHVWVLTGFSCVGCAIDLIDLQYKLLCCVGFVRS